MLNINCIFECLYKMIYFGNFWAIVPYISNEFVITVEPLYYGHFETKYFWPIFTAI